MKFANFVARTDLQVGDLVTPIAWEEIFKIRDIRTIHYYLSGQVEFEFELLTFEGLWFKREDLIVIKKID